MSNEKRMQLLQQAAGLVEQVTGSLNTDAHQCACCSATRYEDFEEHKAYTELDAVTTKLKTWANKLGH